MWQVLPQQMGDPPDNQMSCDPKVSRELDGLGVQRCSDLSVKEKFISPKTKNSVRKTYSKYHT
jgi:hypothetical protein